MTVASSAQPAPSGIQYLGTSGPAVPVRAPRAAAPSGASAWSKRGRVVTAGGMVLAAAVAGFAIGATLNGGSGATVAPHFRSLDPVPGEFRLGPGLAQPPGITVQVPNAARPMPGEFRLGPGLAQPPGIVTPVR